MDERKRKDSADNYLDRENLWDEQWPQPPPGQARHLPEETDNLDEELPFPDEVGTTDSISAVRDAEPYMPPTDPPVLPGGREGIHVATGFGVSPEEETYRDPDPRGDLDIQAEILEILGSDSETNTLNLDATVRQGVVHLRGTVPSVMDADRAMNLMQYVSGVVDVVDDTTVDPAAQG